MRVRKQFFLFASAIFALVLAGGAQIASAAARKSHSIVLGVVHHEPYSQQGDPAGFQTGETSLPVRALIVNGHLKDWTTGNAHDITERSFVVRRAVRLNNSLPGDRRQQWVWQRGPWLLVDRVTGRVTAVKLLDYDPQVSRVAWFRDYAAYCGVTPSGKSLHAMVEQLGVRKSVLTKKLEAFGRTDFPEPACAPVVWQRDPVRVTFHAAGKDAVTYSIAPGSAVLVEDSRGGNGQTPDATPAAVPAAPAKGK